MRKRRWLGSMLVGLGVSVPLAATGADFVGHPKLLFAPDAIPDLRAQLQDGGDDDLAYSAIRTWATTALGTPAANLVGTWEGIHSAAQMGLAAHIEPDGTAFAAKARDIALYVARNTEVGNDEFTSALRLQTMAFGYDLGGDTATPAEREELRHEMRTFLDFMPTRFNYFCQSYNPYAGNHGMTVGASMGLAILALWEDVPSSAQDSLQAQLAFADQLVNKCATDILSPDGVYREGVLYAGWIVRMAAPYFEARQRFDGTDLASDPRWSKMIEWLCYEVDPIGPGRTLNLNDSAWATRPLALHNTILEWAQMRWGDGLARYLHRYIAGSLGFDYGVFADRVATALWSRPLPEKPPGDVLPSGRLFPDRGLYFHRSAWKTSTIGDEMLFSFSAGKYWGGHAQEDQGQFTLTAFGRRWAADCGPVGNSQLPKESAAHNLVLVDGLGQHNAGNSIGTDARVASVLLGGFADYLRGDARDAYATHSPFNAPGVPFPTSDWSWGYDGGNALERANRSVLVVKGGAVPGYVVIADDIRKDAAPRTYDWLLHTDVGHTFDLASEPAKILAPQATLDVFFAHPRAADLELSWAPFAHAGVDPTTRRVVARTQIVEPRFCVALVPRTNSTPPPVYDASDDGSATTLAMDWGTVQDWTVFSPHRTAVTGSVSTDGVLAFVRRDAANVVRWLLAEGTGLQSDTLKLAALADTISAAYAGDTVYLSRADVAFDVWAPEAIAVLGPAGPVEFERAGNRVRSITPTDAAPPGRGRRDIVLEPVQPNPARFAAHLQYRLASAGRARIRILDARGARVATLVDATVGAGLHHVTWSGRDDGGRRCAPGTYFALLEAGGERRTRKLVLAR